MIDAPADRARATRWLDALLPAWAATMEQDAPLLSDEASRLRFAIALSASNVTLGTGGPFGAVVVDDRSGVILAAGVNAVTRLGNPVLHAEIVAIMRATERRGHYSLAPEGSGEAPSTDAACVLYCSCEPCSMCLGAILWSGVRRVVFAARRDDAEAVGFDEGPVFAETFAYLRRRGIEVVGARGPAAEALRADAVGVLKEYIVRGGRVYNG